ncbi:hypothetical protein MKS83_21265 [Chryseobacterium sp. Y16C]|uniref:hypothetical protein n=1 Tax=Chryseobacterium sp. Y16C TaxID=2920939 RepID=UPI001F0B3F8D|nr:hypothetical protein [Chryseobacterium sp. Y16C]UMQ41892.1 hypothetical protein MKS83_21265 [Chryseobacterium sp. Y16C]
MKKIFYIPGLISALIIPFLFWYYINPYIDETNYNIMDIWLPPKLDKNKSNVSSTFEPLRNWKYKQISIEPGKAKENSDFYVSELKKLDQNNIENSGIEFILNDKNTYGDFASLLNDMAVAKHETYAYDLEKTGHFFATVNYKDPNAVEEKVECLLCNDTVYYEDPSMRESILDLIMRRESYNRFFENISKLPKQTYYIIFGFLFFLNISMLSIKERFQLQRLS